MLISVTDHLWVDPRTITSVESITVDRHGQPITFVEVHTAKRYWVLSEVDLHDIVAKINEK